MEEGVIYMQIIASGNKIVDAIGKMNITGNVIPEAWYSNIRYKNGQYRQLNRLNLDLCQYSKHIFSNFLYSFTPC